MHRYRMGNILVAKSEVKRRNQEIRKYLKDIGETEGIGSIGSDQNLCPIL